MGVPEMARLGFRRYQHALARIEEAEGEAAAVVDARRGAEGGLEGAEASG